MPEGSRVWYQLKVSTVFFGSFGKEHRATTVGGEGVSHDFVIPRVLQGPGALNGGVEVRGESNISVRIATRHVDSTEEAEVES
jgi:hypothetical protein